jgi:hypothetical protein
MEPKRITFIVGAGASSEFGLPTGRELLKRISGLARRVDDASGYHIKVASRLERYFAIFSNANHDRYIALRNAAHWISQNALLAPSIDNLLHAHKSDLDIVTAGKAMIAECLLDAEEKCFIARSVNRPNEGYSFLYREDRHTKKSGMNSWLAQLFWLLAEESDFAGFVTKLNLIDFIIFNYDRCVEYFIVNAAASYYNLDQKDMERVRDALSIVHPYGSLGELSIKAGGAFGLGVSANIDEAARGLRTFTEGVGDDKVTAEIDMMIERGKTIVFLGFGYLSLNLDLIFGRDPKMDPDIIVGTALGFSENSALKIKEYLRQKHYKAREKIKRDGGQRTVNDLPIELLNVGSWDIMDIYHKLLRK